MGKPVGLTDAKILGLKAPATGQVEIPDTHTAGLRVRIGTTGVRVFTLRKRVGGKVRNITLGRYGPRFTLAHARKVAALLIEDIAAGKEVAPKAASKAETIAQLWKLYIEREITGKKRSAREIERVGRVYIIPAIGGRMADMVTRSDVKRLVDSVTYANPAKPTPRMGRSVHQQLSAFYKWAMPSLDRLQVNPCRDAGAPKAAKPRDRVLSDAEIKAFWAACGKVGEPFGTAFKLLLLTAQRRSEVFEAKAEEISKGVWTVPASRAKNGEANLVHLSAASLALVKGLPKAGWLFPSSGEGDTACSGITKAHARLCKLMADEMGVDAIEHWTPHDLRRTAATGMQRLGITMPVVEAVLNHLSGSRAGIAGIYQRHHFTDEKRAALDKWAAEVARIVRQNRRVK